jgi:MFS transporter, DHA1 family, solute carrier family 18 (vesicular amine transporter), member 1/2
MGTAERGDAVLMVVTAAIAVETTVFSLVIPALPVFSHRYELSDSVASLIFAAFPIFQLLTAVAIAASVDRLGRRGLLMAGAVLLLISTLGFAIADAPWLLGVARAVQGVGAGLIWVAGVAAVSDTYPHSELGFRLGLVETAGGGIGLLGPLVGGPLIGVIGTSGTFLAASGVTAALVFALRQLPETGSRRMQPLPMAAALGALFSQTSARVGAVSLALIGVILAIVEPLLPLNLEHRLHVSATGVGLVFGIALMAYLIATPIAGRWSDRHGREAPVLAGCVVVAATLPLLGIGSVFTVAAALIVVAVGLAVMASPSGPLLMGAIDRAGFTGHYGFSSSVLTALFALGYALGPLLGALARTTLAFSTLLLVLSGVVLAAAGAIRLWSKVRVG